jgi:hypothetical protein
MHLRQAIWLEYMNSNFYLFIFMDELKRNQETFIFLILF